MTEIYHKTLLLNKSILYKRTIQNEGSTSSITSDSYNVYSTSESIEFSSDSESGSSSSDSNGRSIPLQKRKKNKKQGYYRKKAIIPLDKLGLVYNHLIKNRYRWFNRFCIIGAFLCASIGYEQLYFLPEVFQIYNPLVVLILIIFYLFIVAVPILQLESLLGHLTQGGIIKSLVSLDKSAKYIGLSSVILGILSSWFAGIETIQHIRLLNSSIIKPIVREITTNCELYKTKDECNNLLQHNCLWIDSKLYKSYKDEHILSNDPNVGSNNNSSQSQHFTKSTTRKEKRQ